MRWCARQRIKPWLKIAPAVLGPDLLLHILRNPHGWSEDSVRRARLQAAEELQSLRTAAQDAAVAPGAQHDLPRRG